MPALRPCAAVAGPSGRSPGGRDYLTAAALGTATSRFQLPRAYQHNNKAPGGGWRCSAARESAQGSITSPPENTACSVGQPHSGVAPALLSDRPPAPAASSSCGGDFQWKPLRALHSAALSKIRRYAPQEAYAALCRSHAEGVPPHAASTSGRVVLVDIRCFDTRRRHGIVPGSIHMPRTVLEWCVHWPPLACQTTLRRQTTHCNYPRKLRPPALALTRTTFSHPFVSQHGRRLEPGGQYRSPHAPPGLDDDVVLVICDHGYSSVFAAASLADMGYSRAGDVVGGVEAWAACGLPVLQGVGDEPLSPGELPGMRPPSFPADLVLLPARQPN